MITNIQFLRAIAAISVLFYHTADNCFFSGGDKQGFFGFFYAFGYMGVDIFFVISGFIIWHSTKHHTGGADCVLFLLKRLFRIYLGYWPFFIFAFFMFYIFHQMGLEKIDLLGSFFLTIPLSPSLLIPVTWTLRFELYFYICFAVLVFFPRKSVLPALIIAALLLICFLFHGVLISGIYTSTAYGDGSVLDTFFLSPFCLEFIAGCLTASLYDKISLKKTTSCFLIFTAVCLTCFAIWYQTHVLSGLLSSGYHLPQRIALLGTASVFLVLGMSSLEKCKIRIIPRFSYLLGNASYSIYLFHTVFLVLCHHLYIVYTIQQKGYWHEFWFLLIDAVIIGYCLVHYRFIEEPLYRNTKKMFALLPYLSR